MKRLKIKQRLPVLIGAAAIIAGCGPRSMTPAESKTSATSPVITIEPKIGDVASTIAVTGSLAALQDIALSPKQGGRIMEILVKEGDPVTAGQVVARIDAVDLLSQLRSTEAAVTSARAKLLQAEASYSQQVVTTGTNIESASAAYKQQVSTSSASVRSAKAALSSAIAELSTVREGARTEERRQTQASTAVAQANYNKAESDYNRYQKLHNAGAVSDAEFDQYKNARDVAEANLNSAKAAMDLQIQGNRKQDIDQAVAKVHQAEETLRQAEAAQAQNLVKKADLDASYAGKAQIKVKLADIASAKAVLQQEINALNIARQAVADTVVVSPISGRISSRSAEPGQIVNSGATLCHVVTADSVYYEPSVPDAMVGRLKQNQQVDVTVDAYPNRTFKGSIKRIYPEGSDTNRSITLRVTISNTDGVLRPKMFAQGRILIDTHRNAVLIPRSSVVNNNHIFVVNNGIAQDKVITQGYRTDDGAWIEAVSLDPKAKVVTTGQNSLVDGDKVTVESAATPERKLNGFSPTLARRGLGGGKSARPELKLNVESDQQKASL